MTRPPARGCPPSRVRRRTLALLGVGLGAPLATACASPPPPDRRVRLSLTQVPPGQRVRVEHAESTVEVRRTESGVVARSLMCTHFGCRLRWSDEKSLYVCPCHGGAFDADGRPVAGPPTRPLLPVRAERVGDEIVVGEP